jgi:hypothetical protein
MDPVALNQSFVSIAEMRGPSTWTLPWGSMLPRRGRIVGRELMMELDAPELDLFEELIDVVEGLPWTHFAKTPDRGCLRARRHAIDVSTKYPTLPFVRVGESFPRLGEDRPGETEKDVDHTPLSEVDVFLEWFHATFAGKLPAASLRLRVVEHPTFHGDLPNVHAVHGDAAWDDLERIVRGTLEPSYGAVGNWNFE